MYPGMALWIAHKVAEVVRGRDVLVSQIQEALVCVRAMEDTLLAVHREVTAKADTDIKALRSYESHLFNNCHGKPVIDGNAYPGKQDVTNIPTTHVIKVKETLHKLQAYLKDIRGQYKVANVTASRVGGKLSSAPVASHVVRTTSDRVRKSVSDLQLVHTIEKVNGSKVHVRDLVFHPSQPHLVVRTSEEGRPLRVLELSGRVVRRFGGGVTGLEEYRDLSMDTTRGRYLAACYDHLALLTSGVTHPDGKPLVSTARTPTLATRLEGVAYCPDSDLYVVTDCSDHKVTLVDPASLRITRVFGCEGAGPGQFKRPLHVTTGRIHGNPAIVVSDHDNHRVQVFDMAGTHQATYGGKGRGDGELYYPRGVAIDPSSRVIVCDSVNNRISSYWTDHEGQHWQCLLSRDQLGDRKPINIHMDFKRHLLAIRLDNDSILLYKYT